MTKVVHDTDIGASLAIIGGKLEADATQATDAELTAAIAANNTADATEEQAILDNIRYQEGILHNPPWELVGAKVKAHTGAVVGTHPRFLSIHTKASILQFIFPQVGEIVKGLGGLPDLTVDANGFVTLPGWGALWYKYAGADLGWYYSIYTANFDATVEYIRVFELDHDGVLKGRLSDGSIVHQGMNYPRGGERIGGKAVGSPRHVRHIGVFEGFMAGDSATNQLVGREGDFAGSTIAAGATLSNTVIHFKLPWRANAVSPSDKMYHLHFTGYAYQAAKKVIDFTAVGYACISGVLNHEVQGSHAADTTQYVGSDDHVYVRVVIGSGYFTTISIDSMGVGDGEAMPIGSITAIFDPAATL